MLEALNRLGLPIKYALVVAVVAPLARALFELVGFGNGFGATDYLLTALAGALFGGLAGYLRKRAGKTH